MLPAAKLLMIIVSLFPVGPSDTATVVYPEGERTITCDVVAGAEGRLWQFHEEWQCWSFATGCETDAECEGSVKQIGSFERGADENGKPYKVISPSRGGETMNY